MRSGRCPSEFDAEVGSPSVEGPLGGGEGYDPAEVDKGASSLLDAACGDSESVGDGGCLDASAGVAESGLEVESSYQVSNDGCNQ
jgi:hypothetical protein